MLDGSGVGVGGGSNSGRRLFGVGGGGEAGGGGSGGSMSGGGVSAGGGSGPVGSSPPMVSARYPPLEHIQNPPQPDPKVSMCRRRLR